jgi:FKBP-type peptidyl-prolyl cis-trans isomerase FkpA
MTRQLPLCVLLVTAAACSANAGGGAKANLSTEESKTLYALGFTVGTNLGRTGTFTSDQVASIQAGLGDALAPKAAQVDMPTYGPKVQQMMMSRAGSQAAAAPPADPSKAIEEKKKGDAFAETAAKEAGAEKLPSGLVFKGLTPGTGASPTASDVVKVNYEGKLIDGTVFDASAKHGGAATFPLGHVIPCWTEGVQKLKVGGKAQLVCPSSIAYGDQGHPPTIPGGATLVFTVELLEINPAPAPGAMGAGNPHLNLGGPGAPGNPRLNLGGPTGLKGPQNFTIKPAQPVQPQ